ncbi:protein-methionine-sulfoxide reductase heme-binding subunit MsrQ [Mesorhizobium sp. KR9-304]|uniref:sulfite oxidase heme-binding subunit YedZ n=1 Tax=Mesorhizobium sp. KR9-304 TaxID=3156614 RepID=UPI0032B5CFF7
MKPWTDRSGNFSPLKAAVLVGACLPALLLGWAAADGTLAPAGSLGPLGARPITEAIHQTGDWAIRFLMMSLAVTPLRRIANWPKLIMVRRMLGLAALFYALAHLTLYAIDLKLDLLRVVSEIALRVYLTIGFVALLGLIALGSTSTDAAIRRLGKRWNRLHKIVYPIGLLAALHFFIQSKADVYEPTLMAGFFLLLMFYRLAHWRGFALASPLVLVAIAILAALGTAAIEYAWYGIATGVPPGRVLAANLQFSFSIRPAWWVLATGLGATLLALARPWLSRQDAAPRGRRAARAAAEA